MVYSEGTCALHMLKFLFNRYVCAHTHTHTYTQVGISDASSKILLNCNSSVVCQTQWTTAYLSPTKGYKPIGK